MVIIGGVDVDSDSGGISGRGGAGCSRMMIVGVVVVVVVVCLVFFRQMVRTDKDSRGNIRVAVRTGTSDTVHPAGRCHHQQHEEKEPASADDIDSPETTRCWDILSVGK